MCGIAGGFGREPLERDVVAMLGALAHRGPDGEGSVSLVNRGREPCGAFGHRRLAIIDLSPTGAQPMASADGRLTITYNGEIYNYRELRRELAAEGAGFRGTSDTEVLLVGWQRHGPSFVRCLRGMFAFALWDRDLGRGYLARDGFGIKPLYVAGVDASLLFASEVRALLETGRLRAALSWAGVRSFLATGSVAEPETIVEGVRAIAPGVLYEVTPGRGRPCLIPRETFDGRAAMPEVTRVHDDPEEAASAVRAALRAAVARHLVADVPVALFLSGGIDSSAVVAVASEVTAEPLDTFTVTFAEAEFDESAVARTVAQRFGTRHHEVPLSAADFLQALPDAFAAMDQPSLDGLNTFVVSRAVRAEGVKVVLSGLGGDELFAGYPSFARAEAVAAWRRRAPWLPALARPAARRLGAARGEKLAALLDRVPAPRAAYVASRMLFGPERIEELTGGAPPADFLRPPAELSPLREVSWYEATGYMRNTLLRDSDVFSMVHGLELRVPFVDADVAAAAAAAEDHLKRRDGTSKPLLVAAVADLLPQAVWDRPKRGFTLPFDRWLRGELRGEIEERFYGAELARAGIDPIRAMPTWRDFLRARAGVGWSRPWALYTLVRWARERGLALPDAPGPVLAGVG